MIVRSHSSNSRYNHRIMERGRLGSPKGGLGQPDPRPPGSPRPPVHFNSKIKNFGVFFKTFSFNFSIIEIEIDFISFHSTSIVFFSRFNCVFCASFCFFPDFICTFCDFFVFFVLLYIMNLDSIQPVLKFVLFLCSK